MTWYDLSWTPQFFEHEGESSKGFLDVRLVGDVKIVKGYRYPGQETPIVTPGTVYPVNGLDAQKEEDGQHKTGTVHMFTFRELPVSDNDEQAIDHTGPGSSTPGARLYWHGDVYELTQKENWSSAGVFRYTGTKRHRIPITPEQGPS